MSAEVSRSLQKEQISPEVWVHMGNFFPWSAVVDNKTLVEWVEKSGADKLEWIAAGPITEHIPIGPTHEVLTKPVAALQQIFSERLGHGHVIFNPYASFWSIVGRREDPLRPGEPIAMYNTILSKESVSQKALQKLEVVKNGTFPVVVYPPFDGRDIQPRYTTSLYQTHPAFFNDPRNADEIIRAIKAGEYSGVCFDTYHAQEARASGDRPFGSTEKDLFTSLERFQRAGVLKEVHVQPGRRISLDITIENEKDFKAMFGENPSYGTPTGKMLHFLIHDLGFMGPFTSEIDPRSLVAIYGKKVLLPPQLSDQLFHAQASASDYIRRA